MANPQSRSLIFQNRDAPVHVQRASPRIISRGLRMESQPPVPATLLDIGISSYATASIWLRTEQSKSTDGQPEGSVGALLSSR